MKNRIGKFLAALIFLLLLWFSVGATPRPTITPTITPTPTSNTRDALILRIQKSAQKDVEQDAARQSTSELQALFGNEAANVGLSLNEVKDIYNAAYQNARPVKSPWDELLTPHNGGWLVAGVLFVLFILRNIIKEYLEKLFKKIAEATYQRLARFRPFWWIALRRYRHSLERNFRELKIPFRPERPLLMKDIYVPLQGQGADRKSVAVFEVLQQQRKLVVLGDPGSGKTMFLRHIAFHYAQKELNDFPGSPIPIYLELNRLKADDISLMDSLTKALENNKFPSGGEFLKAHLENKDLLILLDGLDEVDAASRPDIVQQVKDLTQKYPENRLLITCRKAVYQAEFADWNDQELEIIDFNDQQIQRFMTSWQKDMPPDKSIEHFIRNLQERPQIMALARNPLLLTMIAYLYTDTEFALPHSRSEFYSKSTNLLLEQWKLERNHYKAAHKRLVLQHLARFNQEQSARTGERRTIELTIILNEIRNILPDLTLETKDAQPLLDEIAQRSGLLLIIDGGLRYQFTHLTLQEYFAACAFKSHANTLLENFRHAPDDWREVLRLWCSFEHDCTAVLKDIYALDALLALECLSDAQKVETSYADELLESFKPRLSEATENELLANAFALMAADPRKRGIEWFGFLKEGLNNDQLRRAAFIVLTRTNLPQAAVILVRIAARNPDVQSFLAKLGNLAVPSLAELAQRGEIWALDTLVEIGTPQAALVLEPLIWTVNQEFEHRWANINKPRSEIMNWAGPLSVPFFSTDGLGPLLNRSKPTTLLNAYFAAWRLAALLPMPGVEDVLRSVSLTPEQRQMEQITWIWEPFMERESKDSSLPVIAGRIAHLLHGTPEDMLPDKSLFCDQRLALPLCAVLSKIKLEALPREPVPSANNSNEELPTENFRWSPEHFEQFTNSLREQPKLQHLFSSLPKITQYKVWPILVKEKDKPTAEDWRNLFRPIKYIFETSLHEKVFKVLIFLWIGLNIWYLLNPISRFALEVWSNSIFLFVVGSLGLLVILIPIIVLLFRNWSFNTLRIILYLFLYSFAGAIGTVIWDFTHSPIIGGMVSFLIGGLVGIFVAKDTGINILTKNVLINMSPIGCLVLGLASAFGCILGGELSIWLSGSPSILPNYSPIISFSIFLGTAGSLLGGFVGRGNISFDQKVKWLISVLRGGIIGMLLGGLIGMITGMVVSASAIYPTEILYELFGWVGVAIFWSTWLGALTFLYITAKRLERQARNPLYGLLDETPYPVILSDYSLSQLQWMTIVQQVRSILFPSDLTYR